MRSGILPSAAMLLLLACQTPEAKVPTPPPEPFKPTLILRPVAVSLTKGATQAFSAEINYQEGVRYTRQPVGWRVVEPAGGTVTGAGLYTAPDTAGTYHVQVRREDFPEVLTLSTVTVK